MQKKVGLWFDQGIRSLASTLTRLDALLYTHALGLPIGETASQIILLSRSHATCGEIMATFRTRLLMSLTSLITMATMKLILPNLLDQEIGMILIWYELIKLL